jgi:L-amino acid N-acyltransferase YncA
MSAVYTISAYPKEVQLRNQTKVVVRPLAAGDADALLDFFLSIPEDERYYLKHEVTAPAVVTGWVQNLDFRRTLPLVALDGDRIVGEAVLIRERGQARSHLGELRIVVTPDYRDKGLGTVLIRELCDIASDAEYKGILFEVIPDTEREAYETAQWLGFIRTGTIEGGARDQNGHLHDVALMVMPLGKWYEWSKY